MDNAFRYRIPIVGKGNLPVDNGYLLYSALCRLIPEIHGAEHVAISPIEGVYLDGKILTYDGIAHFWIQVPLEEAHLAFKLAGKKIVLGDYSVRLGIPRIEFIEPSNVLFSRIVSVKGKLEEEQLREYLKLQLERLFIASEWKDESLKELSSIHVEVQRRRVMQINGFKVVGFGIKLHGLSDRMSLAVQKYSLAGKRRFGMSFFLRVME